MRKFKHYIITQFNLGMYNPDHSKFSLIGNPKAPGISLSPDEWMDHRIDLFKRFTLPSVMAQTNQNFGWIVLVDNKTPARYISYLLLVEREYYNLQVFCIPIGELSIVNAALQMIDTPGKYDLITTRLDNDDIINKHLVADIQEVYAERNAFYKTPWTIILPHGYTYDLENEKLYFMDYRNNQFITLVENSLTAKTAWQCPHGDLAMKHHGMMLIDRLYWVIVVHSQNLGNNLCSSPDRDIKINEPVDLAILKDFGVK